MVNKMNISAHEEYGLRCAIRLAKAQERGSLAASKIAGEEGLSVEYVSKILHLFRKAKLVKASRGIHGGFSLARPAREIFVKEVFQALSSKLVREEFCRHFSGQRDECANFSSCSARPLWSLLQFYLDGVVGRMSLEDVSAPEEVVRERLLLKLQLHLSEFVSDHSKNLENSEKGRKGNVYALRD
ncbi:MAG: Rrf2 family transcriptional regulator [Bradymonadales bacterium]|nr:MAG: Rrf2 family transcriptional regulator [Bradymonadales bacterium]